MKGRIDKKGASDHPERWKTKEGGSNAHEHYRTGEGIYPVAARVGESEGMGVEEMSTLWKHGHKQVGIL